MTTLFDAIDKFAQKDAGLKELWHWHVDGISAVLVHKWMPEHVLYPLARRFFVRCAPILALVRRHEVGRYFCVPPTHTFQRYKRRRASGDRSDAMYADYCESQLFSTAQIITFVFTVGSVLNRTSTIECVLYRRAGAHQVRFDPVTALIVKL